MFVMLIALSAMLGQLSSQSEQQQLLVAGASARLAGWEQSMSLTSSCIRAAAAAIVLTTA